MGARPDWSSLPWDTLSLILQRLPWSSHPSFASVCRHWRSAVSPFYLAWITPLLFNAVDLGSTNVRYYSPYFAKNFEVDNTLEVPGGAAVCGATGKHLMLCTRQQIHTAQLVCSGGGAPAIDHLPPMSPAMFDSVVYDGARRVFGVNGHLASTLSIGRCMKNDSGEWGGWDTVFQLDDGDGAPGLEVSPVCSPVLHNGALYVLTNGGRLAVYDEHEHEEGVRILKKPKGFGLECECEDCYLVESDRRELMAVLVGHRGTPVHVVKLMKRTMEWKKVESLNGRTLFAGTLTTLMKKANIKWMENKIFLPKFYDWPDQPVHADLVRRCGEFAFVPKSSDEDTIMTVEGRIDRGAGLWSYELGQQHEARDIWGTTTVDSSIWVDFRNNNLTNQRLGSQRIRRRVVIRRLGWRQSTHGPRENASVTPLFRS